MNLEQAQAAYKKAYEHFARTEASIDAIEQFPDREAELRADARYSKAERALKAAIDELHAQGGRTFEEIERSAPPSERFAIRSQGDQFGLGESWEIYDKATDKHVGAEGSHVKAIAAIAKADEIWHRRKATRERRASQ
jgi:hypothetical protein